MSIQAYTGKQIVVVEKRKSNGALDFSEPQPPISQISFDGLYQMFFRECKDAVGTWENLRSWLNDKGWSIRPKTW
jgi:hypothetical protein